MMKLLSLATTGLLLALLAPWATALEMGELVARSRLGQPFVGEIRIKGELYSQISPDCVRLVKPMQANDLPGLPPGIGIEYVSGAQGGVVRLIGQQKVLDPALQVAVFIGCGVNLQRDYVVMLDLPGQPERLSESAPTSATPTPTTSSATPRTPRPTAARVTKARPASSPRQQASAPARETVVKAAPIAAAQPPAAAPVEPVAPPPTTSAEAPATVPAGPAPQATAPTTAADSDPLISAGLILLIALLLLGIWYQHRRNIRAAAREDDPDGSPRNTENTLRGRPDQARATPPAPSKTVPIPSKSKTDEEDEMPILPASASGEYMMDLTDVMLSFGETQRALRALHEFVHEHPDDAVAPWLRLLELLRKHDKREEFQALAIKLHQVFNVATPQWEAAKIDSPATAHLPSPGQPQPTDSLEDFTHVRQRLVDTWGTPEGIKYLDILMRDNRAGQRRGFPVQIMEEAILLREILALRLNIT